VLENEALKCIFKRLHYTLPHRNFVSTQLLDRVYDDVANGIRAEIHGIQTVSLTLDFWLSKQRISYLGATVHYLKDALEFKNKTLTVQHVSGRHTRQVVAGAVLKVLDDWN
jgi:hypothetical protein